MKFSDLANQFSTKRRTVNDLARYIKNRTDDNSNYCLLLGAGCSITSGIRPASVLIQEWRAQSCSELGMSPLGTEEAQINYLRQHGSQWYDAGREYSSLFERRFDLQRQRRVFVESEVAGKTPSIGYAYLTSLVEKKLFNTIFTTNFDDLVNEAFYLFSSERPIVCAHDSSINSVTVTSKRPKVIKLHGDYLFDDLKSTLRETESLEQNMKSKLAEFSKDHGLIVVGYSGADRSIMDNLQALLRNDEHLKSGIYWCLRKNSEVPEELRKLLFRDRVYYVEIDGFDELLAELYSIFNPGHYVPEAALGINRRSGDTLKILLSSTSGVPSTTDVLRKARARLEKHTKRTAIAHLIARDGQDDRSSVGGVNFTDDELLLLSEVSECITSERYEAALEKARQELRSSPRNMIKRRLMEQCITAYMAQNNRSAAIALADEIIALQPRRAASYMKKSRLLANRTASLAEVQRAIEVDEFSVEPRIALCAAKLTDAERSYGEQRKKYLEEAHEAARTAIRLDPSAPNPAWISLFNVIEKREVERKSKEALMNELIQELSKQNPFSVRVLEMRYRLALVQSSEEKKKSLKDLLSDIEVAEQRYSENQHSFLRIRLRSLKEIGDESSILNEVAKISGEIDRDPDLAALVASILRECIGQDNSAIKMLRESLRSSQFDWEILTSLIRALCDLGEIDEAQALFDKWRHRLGRKNRHRMRLAILEERERFDECLKEVVAFSQESGVRDVLSEVYYLLCTEGAQEAEKMLRELLSPINFTPEAEVEIVNYELARKLNGAKPDHHRLQKVLDFTSSDQTKVGIYAVLEKKEELCAALKSSISKDKTSRYLIRKWPAMKKYLNDKDIAALLRRDTIEPSTAD